VSSFKIDRPDRMYRSGRSLDQVFDESELLYNRCLAEHIEEERLLATAIRFPDWSVNRAKYSEPEDVLIPDYLDWGIAAFEVGNVPKSLTSPAPGNVKYDFRVAHDPVEDNYSHSEVRTYKDEHHEKKLDVNKTVKKLFRQILSEKTVIIRKPLNNENSK
jgi:hypothetical protein